VPSDARTFLELALLLVADPMNLVHVTLHVAFDGLGLKHLRAECLKAVFQIAICVTDDDKNPVRVAHNNI
jgi:hypothetical protein